MILKHSCHTDASVWGHDLKSDESDHLRRFAPFQLSACNQIAPNVASRHGVIRPLTVAPRHVMLSS